MIKTRLLNAEEMAEIYASQATGTLIAERLAEAERLDAEKWEVTALSGSQAVFWFSAGGAIVSAIVVALYLWSMS